MNPETGAKINSYIRAHRRDGGGVDMAKKDKTPELVSGDKEVVKEAEKKHKKGGGEIKGEEAMGNACRRKRGAGGRFAA